MPRRSILVDSSIWIDHFHRREPGLDDLLRDRRVLLHPMIIGEIALGSIAQRSRVLQSLTILPQATLVGHAEVIAMIGWLELGGSGIGFVDAHLLASTRQLANGQLWTRDKKLCAQAERLGVAHKP